MAEGKEQAEGSPPRVSRAGQFIPPTIALVIFGLGLLAGMPIAMFGFELLVENAAPLFAGLLGLFALVVLVTVLILAFRKPIWDRLFRFGQVEVDRFARPLGEVARYAAEQKVAEATAAAQDLAEMVLARYSWVITRRWLVATVTAFIAAIAALAGAALLFQQNQLLRIQIDRVTEQTGLLRNQIELGEAQRSTSIVPEILAIGEALGIETAQLMDGDGREDAIFSDFELSMGLQTRIVAATNAARPYRYLRYPMAQGDALSVNLMAFARRDDLAGLQAALTSAVTASEEIYGPRHAEGDLADRPVSPERGQLLSLLYGTRVMETEFLNFAGADFSFAEVRVPVLAGMSFQHGLFRYADFSHIVLHSVDFGAAYLDGARFTFASLQNVRFSGVPADEMKPPYAQESGLEVWRTSLNGADFRGAVLIGNRFDAINGLAIDFDGSIIDRLQARDAGLAASTFRSAIIGAVDFSGTDLSSIDLDGAIVFDPDFLDNLEAQAEPDTFNRNRFTIAPADIELVASHPRYEEVWRIAETETSDPFVIRRVSGFE